MCSSDLLVNTGIENAVNLASEKLTAYGKIAKDAASGAVLVSAIASVAVGIVILWQPEAFRAMFEYYSDNIPVFIVFVASFILSLVFVFAGPIKIKEFFVKR